MMINTKKNTNWLVHIENIVDRMDNTNSKFVGLIQKKSYQI